MVFLKSFLENVSFEEADKNKTAADKFIKDSQHVKSSSVDLYVDGESKNTIKRKVVLTDSDDNII